MTDSMAKLNINQFPPLFHSQPVPETLGRWGGSNLYNLDHFRWGKAQKLDRARLQVDCFAWLIARLSTHRTKRHRLGMFRGGMLIHLINFGFTSSLVLGPLIFSNQLMIYSLILESSSGSRMHSRNLRRRTPCRYRCFFSFENWFAHYLGELETSTVHCGCDNASSSMVGLLECTVDFGWFRIQPR